MLSNTNNQSTILKPGQQAQLSTINYHLSTINGVDIDAVMGWKSGFFEFDNMELSAIMRQISRWYDVDVKYEGSKTKEEFGGRISKELSLLNLLAMLETNGLTFRLEGKNLIVQP